MADPTFMHILALICPSENTVAFLKRQICELGIAGRSRVQRLQAHGKAARAVTFARDGELLLTASSDRSILAVNATTGKPVARLTDAHESGIDRLTFMSDAVLASGDPLPVG